MKCYYHPTLDAVQYCSVCRRELCASCSHNIRGKVYCQDCLVAGTELAAIARTPRFSNYSPGRAALMAVIPGLGAVYNQQYTKAVSHFAIFFALWVLADKTSEVFGLAVLAFYIFMIMDAYRSAQAIIRRRVAHPEWTNDEQSSDRVNAPLWGGGLVVLGLLFLLDNLGVPSFDFLANFWPLILVGLGLYLIADYYRSPKRPTHPVESAEEARLESSGIVPSQVRNRLADSQEERQ